MLATWVEFTTDGAQDAYSLVHGLGHKFVLPMLWSVDEEIFTPWNDNVTPWLPQVVDANTVAIVFQSGPPNAGISFGALIFTAAGAP